MEEWCSTPEATGGLLHRPPATVEGAVVSVNFFGYLAFAVSAGYVLPTTSEVVNVTLTTAATTVGALAFLIGSALLQPEGANTIA